MIRRIKAQTSAHRWATVVEDHVLDAIAARERATDDRRAAEQVEAEAIREVWYWEVAALELAFEVEERR